MDVALRALNRFGLGARIGERGRLFPRGAGVSDAKQWLLGQLEGEAPQLPAPAGVSPTEIGEAIRGLRMANQANDTERQQARRRLQAIGTAESRAALMARVTTDRPFVERLVAFWSNHLCVSTAGKLLVGPLAGSYEREAIRPHVLGRFVDMVLASAKHPAMLVYLDNFQSVGPGSRGAQAGRGRGGAGRGLNENYARELLELHTLGVDGGYTQADVQELAKILTGWAVEGLLNWPAMPVQGARRPGIRRGRGRGAAAVPQASNTGDGAVRFTFQPLLHEPGTKTVLGIRYPERGVEEGEQAIRALCRHPSTAEFVARKLATHFVADDSAPGAVRRLAQAFHDSDGDLRTLSQTLIDLPEAWHDDSKKFRAPQDWLVAVLRAFDAREVPEPTPAFLRQLRHPLWAPPAPNGFPDTLQAWADPDSLLNRAELARTVTRRLAGRGVDPQHLLETVDVTADDPLRTVLTDASIAVDERLALAIAGPAFQWR